MNKNICILLLLFVFAGCKKWDKHNAITDPMVGKDIFQRIQETPDLSKFAELLVKSGYDKTLGSSQTFTVFAPTNAALAALDPAIVSDDAKLKLFVANHITNQLQPANGSLRLQMMSGKYNNLGNNKFDDATITAADQYAKNGLIHIINKMVPVLSNGWEFVQTNTAMPAKQKAYLLANDSALSKDYRNEAKQFTFFVLVDTAWDSEVNRYKQYFITGTPDSTANLASNAVVSDFVAEGVYQSAAIPDTILSRLNTKLGIDKATIVQTTKLSNGIVYVMRKLQVQPRDKFKQIIIQGESYDFSRVDRRNNTYFRQKFNPVTNQDFTDVLVFNHGVAQFYLGYRLRNIPSIKYKAYWVAVHDNINNNTGTFKQLLGIGAYNVTTLPYITVQPNNFNEVLLGEFTLPAFRPTFEIYLTADNSTNADASKITVDYIRLEPVL